MENIVKAMNELLISLGHNNIMVTELPIFKWNGNTVTNDETAQTKVVESYNNVNFNDFLEKNKENKIVIYLPQEGHFINNNVIRVAILK
jgi:hypothetical protein